MKLFCGRGEKQRTSKLEVAETTREEKDDVLTRRGEKLTIKSGTVCCLFMRSGHEWDW